MMNISRSSQRRYKWALDLNTRAKQDKSLELPSPPGYSFSVAQVHTESSKENDTSHLLKKKSWEVALGPLKQVPMNLFIMYMAGSSISIFPIMMVGMLIIRPIKALFSTKNTFKMMEGGPSGQQKLVFILGNIVNVGLAIYKCHSMGLLPSHSSDWLAFVEPPLRVEYSDGGLTFVFNGEPLSEIETVLNLSPALQYKCFKAASWLKWNYLRKMCGAQRVK